MLFELRPEFIMLLILPKVFLRVAHVPMRNKSFLSFAKGKDTAAESALSVTCYLLLYGFVEPPG